MKTSMRPMNLCMAFLLALLCGVVLQAQDATTQDSIRLERMLKRFPNADANGDGVLTLDEARRYRQRVRAERGIVDRPSLPLPEGTTKRADLEYGPHGNNVLDLYLPKEAEKPMPLVIFIHGGGFIDGDKNNLSPVILHQCLLRGMAVASINYRFITTDPFPAPLHDSARAVQYLRHHASKWDIDPKRIALFGGSAGGGASLWVALHDDLADPGSADAVARESTRVACAAAIRGQTSYDPRQMREWLGDAILQHRCILPLYGAKNLDEVLNPAPERASLYVECSPIHHVSAGDPPVLLFYTETVPNDPGGAVHSKIFGEQLKAAMDAAGASAKLIANMRQTDDAAVAKDLVAFLAEHLGPGK